MAQSEQSNHIQIPSSILRSFSNKVIFKDELNRTVKKWMIYRMDMNGKIDYVDIDDVNAQKGFYSEEKESKLCEIETKFGEIKAKILNAYKQKQTNLQILPQDIDTIRLFFRFALSRSEEYKSGIKRNLIFAPFVNYDTPYWNEFMMQIIEGDELFQNFYPLVLSNNSECPFIIPQKCWYSLPIGDYSFAIMPLSPNLALALFSHPMKKTTFDLQFPGDFNGLNKLAIQQEYRNNKRAVFAKRKEDLEKYIPFIKGLS